MNVHIAGQNRFFERPACFPVPLLGYFSFTLAIGIIQKHGYILR